jgi:hypothetical protein
MPIKKTKLSAHTQIQKNVPEDFFSGYEEKFSVEDVNAGL